MTLSSLADTTGLVPSASVCPLGSYAARDSEEGGTEKIGSKQTITVVVGHPSVPSGSKALQLIRATCCSLLPGSILFSGQRQEALDADEPKTLSWIRLLML